MDVNYVVGSVWYDDCTADIYCVVAIGKTQSGANWVVVEAVDPPNLRSVGPEIELLLTEVAFCRFKVMA